MEFNDDTAALKYIEERGYASYSSIKNVRDFVIPTKQVPKEYYKFGTELHARLLENKSKEKLDKEQKVQLELMLKNLNGNSIVRHILDGAKTEVPFDKILYGFRVFGYIDILNTTLVGDLKSTRIKNKQQFADSMDFLQAALYLAVTGHDDFYYIGAYKQAPYTVSIFNVNEYPKRLMEAKRELHRLLVYISSKVKYHYDYKK